MDKQKIYSWDFCLVCKVSCVPCNGNRCKCGMNKQAIKENNEKILIKDEQALDEYTKSTDKKEFIPPSILQYQQQLDKERWGTLF